ncbi:hypothetical protein Tco_0113381, partial [Tanacetum coccineum]
MQVQKILLMQKSTAKDAGEAPNKNRDLKTYEKPVDKEYQVFLDELKRIKRQEQDANNATEALRKEFTQETEDLLLQARYSSLTYITAKVVGKPVSIFEASIRSDLLFDDADGIDSLPNQAIFDAIQLMG